MRENALLFVCFKVSCFAHCLLLSKTVRITCNWGRIAGREGWSGLVLTKSTHVNVISIVTEKAVEPKVYCYGLLTFSCDKGLTSTFIPFSFHRPSVQLFPESKHFLYFRTLTISELALCKSLIHKESTTRSREHKVRTIYLSCWSWTGISRQQHQTCGNGFKTANACYFMLFSIRGVPRAGFFGSTVVLKRQEIICSTWNKQC